MNLTHLVALRLLRGATAGPIPAPPTPTTTPIGRRRRTRTYRTPTPQALRDEYNAIAEVAPQVIAPLVGRYVLRGDIGPEDVPPPAAVDWEALAHDAEVVVKMFDLYLELVDDEEVTVLLLGEF